jgi:hypothetical protein
MKRFLWIVLVLGLIPGCALFEEPVEVGDPIIDPVTLETRDATNQDVLASIDAIIAKIDAVEASMGAMAPATNPLGPFGLAGTAGFGLLYGLAQRKKAALLAEKAKLEAQLQEANA